MSRHLCLLGSSIAVLAGVLLMVHTSWAQPGRGVQRGAASVWKYLTEKYDKNDDGRITKDEYDRSADTFSRLDRDRDGVLTRQDWQRAVKPLQRGQRPGGGRRGVAPRVGMPAPDFELTEIRDASKTVKLSSFAGEKPVALIFGSCT